MREFFAYLIKNLVDNPESVEIELVTEEGNVTRVMIHVAEEDVGKVVGKKGRTISALRVLASIMGARFKQKMLLDLARQ